MQIAQIHESTIADRESDLAFQVSTVPSTMLGSETINRSASALGVLGIKKIAPDLLVTLLLRY
jgi:hypothetical protein